MSYCRFSEDSGVYMYPHVGGFIECCGCRLAGEPADWATTDHKVALMHLVWHLKAGDKVPDFAFQRLINEIAHVT